MFSGMCWTVAVWMRRPPAPPLPFSSCWAIPKNRFCYGNFTRRKGTRLKVLCTYRWPLLSLAPQWSWAVMSFGTTRSLGNLCSAITLTSAVSVPPSSTSLTPTARSSASVITGEAQTRLKGGCSFHRRSTDLLCIGFRSFPPSYPSSFFSYLSSSTVSSLL